MTWFNAISRKHNDKRIVEVDIIDQIGKNWWTGDGVAANEFISQIDDFGETDTIKVRISSPGGNISDGIAIYNYLKRHSATVETVALSEAASIASVIFLAGDKRTVCDGTTIMIHDPLAWAGGFINIAEAESLLSTLKHYQKNIANIYQKETGLALDDIQAMMTAETYLSVDEALALGFATDLDSTLTVNQRSAAYFEAVKHKVEQVPAPIHSRSESMSLAQLVEQCEAADCTELLPILAKHTQRKNDATQMIASYQQVKSACAVANLNDQSVDFFEVRDDPAKLIGKIIHAMEKQWEADIDPVLKPEPVSTQENLTDDIYRERKASTIANKR